MKHAFESGMCLYMFPPCTTHFIQMWDDQPFAQFKRVIARDGERNLWDAIATNKPTRWAFLQAAFDAEEKWKKEMIQTAFKHTGIYPFDADRVNYLARLNLGGSEQADTIAAMARSAADDVIKRARLNADELEEATVSGKALIIKSKVYDATQLLANAEEKARVDAAEKKEKEEKAEERADNAQKNRDARKGKRVARSTAKCQGKHCEKDYRGGNTWQHCPCLRFNMCGQCYKASPQPYKIHASSCARQRHKRHRKGEEQ